MKSRTVFALIAAAMLAAIPAVAFAYSEGGSVDPTHTTCVSCHSATSSPATTATMEVSRSGPHGGYSRTTTKCAICHEVHKAGGIQLLPKATIKDTCNTCHDGTGGNGVYGVLAARGFTVVSSHSIDATNMVPGGNASNGGDATMTFSGTNDYMTCTDCHSPHDSRTVAPFIGDRRRTTTDSVVATAATDRLLKQNPGGAVTTTTVYGSNWCGGCHQGRLRNDPTTHNHPVETTANAATPYSSGNLWRIATSASPTSTPATATYTQVELGQLGGNNNAFLIMTPRPWPGIHFPICQQCHNDPRFCGSLNATGSAARPGTYTVTTANGLGASDNPRVQVFPHESTSTNFLVEQGDDLCTNCHPLGAMP